MKTKIANTRRLTSLPLITCQFLFFAALLLLTTSLTACVDNDDDIDESYYEATKMTAAEFLENSPERFSDFVAILKRTPYFAMLSTYGTYSSAGLLLYTVYAPTNEAIQNYVRSEGFSSIDQISDESCDTIARTHIIKKGAFFTTDYSQGNLPEQNMNEGYVSMSSKSDSTTNNQLVYYVNKVPMVEYDDSVTNGVVHVLDGVMLATRDLLPDKLKSDSTITLFTQALYKTGLHNLLTPYIDETYTIGEDSVNLGKLVRCTSGSELYTRSFWPAKRYFKFTAFVEPDEVYRSHGITNIDELTAYAKRVYDATYPEDAGLYDDDPLNRKNPLNRFVAYHLLPRVGQYNSWVCSGYIRQACYATDVNDPDGYYETLCPGTIMRFAGPSAGLFINRKGLQNRATVRGAKVYDPSEDETFHDALNGTYHYIDDILAYSTEVRDVVLNRRIRIDATALSPDFMNNDGRGRYGENILTGFKNKFITDWTASDETYVGVHSDVAYWNSYEGNAVCVSGIFDLTFKLPPVPSGTYEIRLGYTCGDERGVIQVYLNNVPCGIPVDLRDGGWVSYIGWVEDTDDEEENTANDKAMHNRGYMKSIAGYHLENNAEKTLRSQSHILRRILTTSYLSPDQDNFLRVRQCLKDPMKYWSFDYIELCPKSVYGSPEGEDIY